MNKPMKNAHPDWILRPCQRNDLPAVTQIEAECFPGEAVLSVIAMAQYFELFGSTFVVAELEGKVIGFGIGGKVGGNLKEAWLLDDCVLPEYRRQGIGKSICEWMIRELKKQGVEKVRGTVSPKNNSSRTMLESLGFKILDKIPNYFGLGEDRLIVELKR